MRREERRKTKKKRELKKKRRMPIKSRKSKRNFNQGKAQQKSMPKRKKTKL